MKSYIAELYWLKYDKSLKSILVKKNTTLDSWSSDAVACATDHIVLTSVSIELKMVAIIWLCVRTSQVASAVTLANCSGAVLLYTHDRKSGK